MQDLRVFFYMLTVHDIDTLLPLFSLGMFWIIASLQTFWFKLDETVAATSINIKVGSLWCRRAWLQLKLFNKFDDIGEYCKKYNLVLGLFLEKHTQFHS